MIVAFCHNRDNGQWPLDMVALCHYCFAHMAITEIAMKKTSSSQDLAKMNIRLPLALRKKLKEKAEREGRSMNAQAVQILGEKLNEAA